MNSNFEYYKIFYYVAKYENLTKAATALKTSQPAVTRTIHKLEGELRLPVIYQKQDRYEADPGGEEHSMVMWRPDAPSFSKGRMTLAISFLWKMVRSISVRRRLLFTVICFRRWKNSTVCIRM